MHSSWQAARESTIHWCGAAQEGIVLLLLAVGPWWFGGADADFRGLALCALAIFAVVTGIRLLLDPTPIRNDCPVAAALAGLFLLTAFQLIPLPPSLLQIISPRSLELYRELVPILPEVFSGESSPLTGAALSWRPISLYPYETRQLLVQLLAIFLVAIIVRSHLAGPATLRRLGWLALVNGSALSVFALIQAQSARKGLVYWTQPVGSDAYFGPFINRNHFPDYVSLCLGLSAVLLSRGINRRRHPPPATLLHDSPRLAVIGGMILMAVACLFSMSRGGVLSMVGAVAIVAIIAWKARAEGSLFSKVVPAAVMIGLLLVLWLGSIPIESRLATIAETNSENEGRLQMWANVLPHLAAFPILGSGGGTFNALEPMYRPIEFGIPHQAVFAHNEYLEAAFEGGVPRLVLTLLLAGMPCWLVWRRLRRSWANPWRPAFLGLLWGLSVVALHSVVEFGVHMAAIALLAVTAATHLSALRPESSAAGPAPAWPRLLAAMLAVPLALFLAYEGATTYLADRPIYKARLLVNAKTPEERAQRLSYWAEALRLRPNDPALHQAMGLGYLEVYFDEQARFNQRDHALAATRAVLLTTAVPNIKIVAALALDTATARAQAAILRKEDDARTAGQLLRPAAYHLVRSRDGCPVSARTQAALARLTVLFDQSDPPTRYLERATQLLPPDADSWFALGREYLKAGQADLAEHAWRQCLKANPERLPDVLDLAVKAWGTDSVRRVLPDQPELWAAAAERLFPGPAQRALRRPFLEQALALLEQSPPSDAVGHARLATIQRQLGRRAEAEASYRAALHLNPDRHDWRLELARLLRQLDRLNEAKAEVDLILRKAPHLTAAKDLQAIIAREIELREP